MLEMHSSSTDRAGGSKAPAASSSISIATTHKRNTRDRLSSNLIDLNSPPHDHDYVNDNQLDVVAAAIAAGTTPASTTPNQSHGASGAPKTPRDVFDMRKI